MKKRIFSMVLTAALCAAMLPTTVWAAEATPVTGTEQLANNVNTDKEKNPIVYYGEYNGSPAAWYVIGYNDVGVVGKDGTDGNTPIATLLATGKMGETPFGQNHKYLDGTTSSDLKKHVDRLAYGDSSVNPKVPSIFSTGEQAAVKVRDLNVASDGTGVAGTKVEDALLWPLSMAEATNLTFDICNIEISWWLRSPIVYTDDQWVAFVSSRGWVNNGGCMATSEDYVRPAFNLDLNSVLFTSAANGGKPDELGDLKEIQTNTGNEWKLTLLDSNRNTFSIDNVQHKRNSTTVSYSGAMTGAGEYISAIVADSSGKFTHYGKLGAATAAAGSVTFTLPELEAGSKLYIINEQCNGDKKTDYASEPIEVVLPRDGREVELQKTDTHIQWRYVGEGDDKWRDLVALSTLTGVTGADGADGREIELKVADGYIQWRYTTGADTAWKNLIETSALTGADGREVELRNDGTSIQWRYKGEADDAWKDLVALNAITGADGREVALQVADGYIQWRYTTGTDTAWKNLIALSALQGTKGDKGDKGDPGANGETPTIGANGNWWIGGVDTGTPASGGSAGKDGKDGKDGQNGLAPYIGSNGNWWIGNTDTGIKAAGPSGANGANGSDGKDGRNGTNGKDGVGVQSVAVNDEGELVITLTDGSVHNAGKVVGANGKDGAGVAAMAINDSGELIVTLTDGTELNAGAIPVAAAEDSGLRTIVYVSLGMAGVSLAGLLGLLVFLLTRRKKLIGK